MARKGTKSPILADTVRYEGQDLPGWTLESTEHRHGVTFFSLVEDATQNTARVISGTWFVNGAWLNETDFARVYDVPPEPEPVADVVPPLTPLPPESEPAVTPTIHRIVPIEDPPPPPSIGPSALVVDQGRMS